MPRHRLQAFCATALIITLVGAVAGCGQGASPGKPADHEPGKGLVKRTSVEKGPVRVTVEVQPSVARLSDEPTLTVTIDYEPGVQVEKPPFGESIGDFLIRDFREPLPRVAGGREIVQQIYTLEPTRTGQLTVWPVAVTFTDPRTPGAAEPQTVETEGLTIKVASVLDSDAPSLADLKPATGPVELPRPRSYLGWWLLAGAIVLGGAGAVTYWLRLRRLRAAQARPPTPQELAHRELDAVLARDLGARDVKLFYVELTGVVRRYIERSTGVRAPEQTTEEFLREISQRNTFPAVEGKRLQYFLESADLVKFAGHQPRQEDMETSIERARAFIGTSWTGEAAA